MPVPIRPLRGLWGSMFSRKDGGLSRPLRQGLFSRIELAVGQPLP